jgi:type I restriction enzyme S subunit
MATSQDFVSWVCGAELDPHFLSFLFLAQGDELFKFSSGAVHQTIYFPEAKAFFVCIPSLERQQKIAAQAEKLKHASVDLEKVYERKLAAIDELKQSILQKAFSGGLTSSKAVAA